MAPFNPPDIETIARVLTRGHGAVLVVGDPGAGKTELARSVAGHSSIAEHFGPRIVWVAAETARTYGELLATTARALDVAMGVGAASTILHALGSAPALLIVDDLELTDPDELVEADEFASDIERRAAIALLVTTRKAEHTFSLRWSKIVRLAPPTNDATRGAAADMPLPEPISEALKIVGFFPNGLPDAALARTSAETQNGIKALLDGGQVVRDDARVRSRPTQSNASPPPIDAADIRAIVDYYFELLRQRAGSVGASDKGGEALAALVVEGSNIERAIGIGLDRSDPDAIAAADLFGRVMRFGGIGSMSLLERAANAAMQRGDTAAQSALLMRIGEVALARADFAQGRRAFGTARDICESRGDRRGVAQSLRGLAQIEYSASKWRLAGELFTRALALSQEIDDTLGTAVCTERLGDVAYILAQPDEAVRRFNDALALYRGISDRRGEANCLHSLGELATVNKAFDRAVEYLTQAGELHETIGNRLGVANSQFRLGDVAFDRASDAAEGERNARPYYERARVIYGQIGDVRGEANVVLRLGELDAETGQRTSAATNFRHALALQRRGGSLLGQAGTILELAKLERRGGDAETARRLYREALPLFRQLGRDEEAQKITAWLNEIDSPTTNEHDFHS